MNIDIGLSDDELKEIIGRPIWLTSVDQDLIFLFPVVTGLKIQFRPSSIGEETNKRVNNEIHMRTSELKKLLRDFRYGKKFIGKSKFIIWRENNERIYFRFSLINPEFQEISYSLDSEISLRFINIIIYYLNGLPSEVKAYQNYENERIQNVLLNAIFNPSVLNKAEFWKDLGTSLGEESYFEESNSCFKKALEIDPEEYGSIISLAVNQSILGLHEEALESVNKVPEGVTQRNLVTARILRDQGRELQAIPFYESAIAEEPDDYFAYFELITILYNQQHPAFEFWLEKTLKAHRTQPLIANFYTIYLIRQKRFEELAEIDWIADLINPADDNRILMGKKDRGTTVSELNQNLLVVAKLNWKIAKLFRSLDEDSLFELLEELNSYPRNLHLCKQILLLITIVAKMGLVDQIQLLHCQICEDCKQERGFTKYPEFFIGFTYTYLNDWENAISCFAKVLNAEPDEKLVWWMYYLSLENAGRLQEAIGAAEHLHLIDPKFEHTSFNLGRYYGKSGLMGKAEYYYLDAIKKDRQDWEAYENLSFIYLLKRDIDQAQKYFSDYVGSMLEKTLSPAELENVITMDSTSFPPLGKFFKLVELAKSLKNDNTYVFQIQKANLADDPIIGQRTAIENNPFSLEKVLAMLISTDEAYKREGIFEYTLYQQGDFSLIISELLKLLPGLDKLPKIAKDSLINAEKMYKDQQNGDFSMAINGYCKSLEICLKQLVFDRFRDKYRYSIRVDKHLIATKIKEVGGEKFLKFIERGSDITLGEMIWVLKQCESSDRPLINDVREFLKAENKLDTLIQPEIVKKLSNLTRDYRNKAVHSDSFDHESAGSVRSQVLELLPIFKN